MDYQGIKRTASAATIALWIAIFSAQAQTRVSVDIGNPAIGGSTVQTGGGYNISAAGTNIFGAADQFFFNYEQITGDFDLKVRLDGVIAGETWAKAGLMARETLDAGSRHASAFATPTLSGTFFAYRFAVNGGTTNTGSFPVAYPNTWLRLRRVGATFTGYAGVDGQNWQQLGTITLPTPASTLYVGMAVTGASATQTAVAQFRQLGDATGGTVGNVEIPFEPAGPSSRNTGLVITEIMYHPKGSNDLEFVELFNADVTTENLEGFRISGDVDYTFPPNTILAPGGFLVVARNPGLLEAAYGISGVLGPWQGNANAATNALPDDAGTVRLRNRGSAVLLEVNYLGRNPWPVQADGAGHSLVLVKPSYGEADPRAWAASDRIGGSPGRPDAAYTLDPLRAVTINEFLAHTDEPLEDFIELYNHSNQAVDLSGAYLSDDRDTNKFRIPNGTALPARGFISFSQSTLGFALSSGGERIYFVNSNQTRVIEVVVFEAQANGVSRGRYPDGAPGFHELTARTAGAANSGLLIRDVVINELMFHPISDDDDDEYVELYNRGGSAVDISNWRFTDGIDFHFPTNTIIPANGYLVVARNQTNLLARYSLLNTANTIGDYNGALADGGERIALAMPDYFLVTNNSVVSTQANYVVVDEVTYVDHGRWTQWADGGGSSLELIDANSDHTLAANWRDSDETLKSSWTNVYYKELTDNVYPRGSPGADLNEVQVMILGGGEALMDDLEVRSESPSQGPNLVANGTFDTLTGWTIQGNHIASGLEPDGPSNPSSSMHIRASAGGDNGVNRIECNLNSTLAANSLASVRANLRWLRGHRDVLIRLHGGGLEALVTLPVPSNLGTPGQPNSRRVANAGPAIYDVSHAPVLPAADQPVIITARIADPDQIASVQVQYRLDPSSTLNNLVMQDNGTGGDAVANDGLYTATLLGRPAGTLVAFRVQATDARTPGAATALFPPDAPVHECLVRFGDPVYPAGIGIYRMWITAANTNEWQTRELFSNEALDGTFVYNNYRAIYNASARYRGSPFIRPGYTGPNGAACGYVWSLPDDDLFLGQDELNLDSLEPSGRDSTALREITAFSILEQLNWPNSYQRFVHVAINGVTDASRGIPVYTDSQQPNSSYVSSWFPDDNNGEIFKIDDWFEFTDNPVRMQANKSASLQNFTTTGNVKKKARYRWNWEKKSNRGLNDDYSSLFVAVDALNAADPLYVRAVEDVFNIEEWLGALAFRHTIGDWDGYGYQRGKNQFSYRSSNDGKWYMLQWDLDFSLGCNGGHGPEQDLFTLSLDGDTGQNHMPEVLRLYNHPHFRRSYLRTLLRLAQGPLQESNYMPALDARYRALQANGVNTVSPYVGSGAQGISIPAWINRRRTNILSVGVVGPYTNTSFRITSPLDVTSSSNLITISGTAPLLVKDIMVNGIAWPVTWVTVTSFTARVIVESESNVVAIAGQDVVGNTITATQSVNITYTGGPIDPRGAIVINEIMYNPAVPRGSFVELYNRSGTAIDLSGWRLNGVGYTFPSGTIMVAGQFLVLVKDRAGFGAAYPNTNITAFAEFPGQLDNGGETLTLIKPGAEPALDIIIDQVRYDDDPPWPPAADGGGASLQLIDANQDNSRVSNWGSGLTWRNLSRTGSIASATNLLIWLASAGDVYIDDVSLSLDGTNILVNGDFESDLSGTWFVPTNMTSSELTTSYSRSGTRSLHLVSTYGTAGGSLTTTLQQRFPGKIVTNAIYTLTLWWLPGSNTYNLNMRTLPGTALQGNINTDIILATPGSANTIVGSVPPYDPLWLNEVQPVNQTGIPDNVGDRDPWLELYNAGTNTINLEGYFLANSFLNLTQWPFPTGSSIGPGEYKLVWADGETSESTLENLHTSFGLQIPQGSLALSRNAAGRTEVVDYLNYQRQQVARSFGEFPDGQPFRQQVFFEPTPRASNRAQDVTVLINEWLADNVSTLADPADGQFEDWFELHNPGAEAVDLSGYHLTDDLGQPRQFTIPNGTVIPAGGFMLVWADGEPSQNNAGADLHTNFRLGAGGESIALFSPTDILIDSVTFGSQTADISEGRYPDSGPAPFYDMSTPTPGAANIIDTGGENQRPSIDPIGDKYVILGQTLNFQVTASDPDPGQTLTYSLSNPPLGATIGSASGVFNWTPATDQAPTINNVVVQVADNGSPSLTATRNFNIYVSLPPQVSIQVTAGGTGISLQFPTVAGKRYQVQYKDNLTDSSWTNLGDPQQATGNSMQINDLLGSRSHRFYKIQVLD